uniref:CSON010968 protein n=1 Tax=Culicoides sonorensis TaxID=179676 RepID=A0A336LR24_CULSO
MFGQSNFRQSSSNLVPINTKVQNNNQSQPPKRKRNRGKKNKKKFGGNNLARNQTRVNPIAINNQGKQPNNLVSNIDLTSEPHTSQFERNSNFNMPSMHQESIPTFNFNVRDSVDVTVGSTIYLDNFSKAVYNASNTNYDRELLLKHNLWHRFIIHHNGRFSKREIIRALFTLIRTHEFFPIGYRTYDTYDSFLLAASDRGGIEQLFARNLRLKVHDTELYISVQLGAGTIMAGQVHPKTQIILMLRELLEEASLHGNNQCLNIDGFERHPELAEVCVSFLNNYHFTTLIKAMIENEDGMAVIKSIRFSNCGIVRIDPLRHLSKFTNIEHIDLRNNQLEHVYELKHLEPLTLIALDVSGNPFIEQEEITQMQDRIKRMLPTIRFLDGVELSIKVKTEPGLLNNEDLSFDILLDGDQITCNDDMNQLTFKQMYKSTNYWHKVTVFHHGLYNSKQVVSKILSLVDNKDLWPCYYSSFPQYDQFYVHNNFDALEILIRNRLVIKSPGNDPPLELQLNMKVSPFKVGQVDVNEKIRKICIDGFKNGVLHLNSLANREIFKNVIIDMSFPQVVSQILLWASRKVGKECTALHLNNNGIVSCTGMFPLVYFPKLEFLNLKNNYIENFERLSGILQSSLKITSVILEGNPLCNTTMQEYVRNTRHYFPELKTLDGAPVNNELFMLSRQNFLCKPEAYSFVEAFVKHYFTIYDTNQRHMLKEMYMDKATFTLSCNFDPLKSKEVSRMSKYTAKSRNFKRLTNLDQAVRNVFIGPDEIIKAFGEIHCTDHNLNTFCIDVPIYTKQFIVITIDGVFKDTPIQFLDDEFFVHFTRTFTIQSCGTGMGVSGLSQQYKIQNDILLVRNVSTLEKIDASHRPSSSTNEHEDDNELQNNEIENLMVLFQEMTKLNNHWCNRFLREANYDFKTALNFCLKLLESNDIPDNAFIKC